MLTEPGQSGRRQMMERNVYSAASLERVLASFEEHYGMSSDDFYAAHVARSAAVSHISRFHRHTWASFYRDVRRLRGDEFAERVEETLALA
jgi:hypothetical protein